jgi:hypothetical protein
LEEYSPSRRNSAPISPGFVQAWMEGAAVDVGDGPGVPIGDLPLRGGVVA